MNLISTMYNLVVVGQRWAKSVNSLLSYKKTTLKIFFYDDKIKTIKFIVYTNLMSSVSSKALELVL